MSGVTFAENAALRLVETTGLVFDGASDLSGLTIHVDAPTRHRPNSSHPILVYGNEVTGEPEIVLAERGFVLASTPQADGRTAVYALPRRGTAVIFK